MYLAYKFRMYPDEIQKKKINSIFDGQRYAYNYYLSEIKEKGNKYANYYIQDSMNNLKKTNELVAPVRQTYINKIIFRLQDNLKKCKNSKFGFPRYKSYLERNSFTINENDYIKVNLKIRKIKLPDLGEIKIRGYRDRTSIDGMVRNATVSREKNGKYYASVLVYLPDVKSIEPTNIVGIDLGIKMLATLSDGNIYENNRYIEKYEKRIKRCHKELSRKQKGSNNYYKCRKKLNILYTELSNARKYYLHKITKEITDNYDIITCEKLRTQEMIENTNLSKKISDVEFSEILRQLQYKSKRKGKHFYQASEYYPSSQTCSVCGHIDKKYKNLGERIYECNCCQNVLDRDLNASINIMFEGLKLFMKNRYLKKAYKRI